MERLAEIRQKLVDGKLPRDLIKEGYAKSSVYAVAKAIRDSGLPVSEASSISQEISPDLADLLRCQLPRRVQSLEAKILDLRELIREVGDTLTYSMCILAGNGEAEAKRRSDDWVERELEGKGKGGT